MTHLVDKEKIEKAGMKAGVAVTESVVFGGFVACMIAAVLFDIWGWVG